jgi:branched-chain amino acid aminotransferase
MGDSDPPVWLDGKIVPWEAASTHLITHTLHYGLGAFEGIRSYRFPDGRASIFRLKEHIDRLFDSCRLCWIEPPFSRDQVTEACCELLRASGFTDAYLRPIIYLGAGTVQLGALDPPVRVGVIIRNYRAYYAGESATRGIRCNVSSFRRGGHNAFLSKGKICGQYANSVLAKRESLKMGFEEAILLDDHGHVAEASAENLFVVKNGRLVTPPLSTSVLNGITRATVMELAREIGRPVDEASLTRDQLYSVDEVFLTGTGGEITPVREIDGRAIGSGARGPLTEQIQSLYFRAARGAGTPPGQPFHPEWLTFAT